MELASYSVLSYPSPSHDGWILDTDACNFAIGAVLSQIQDGCEHVICYASHLMTPTQRGYCVTKKRALSSEMGS